MEYFIDVYNDGWAKYHSDTDKKYMIDVFRVYMIDFDKIRTNIPLADISDYTKGKDVELKE